jgi:hypothetical protein
MLLVASYLIISLTPPPAQAALDPNLKECVQRGYDFAVREGVQFCVFPDKTECAVADFNQGHCGDNFKVKTYCVTQGHYVWDQHMCCRSLKYTADNGLAQATCEFDYTKEILAKLILLLSQLFIGGIFFYKISKQ